MSNSTTLEKLNREREKQERLFNSVADKVNWKIPTRPKRCNTREEAQELADAISYFVGGAEISSDNFVLSRGYYFYTGA
jgi:hypothetical protein